MLDYQIIDNPEHLPEGEYGTDLVANSILASRAFFSILQKGLTGFQTYYVVVYINQRPAALVCVNETHARLAGWKLRFLMCGNPVVSADSAIFTRSDFERRDILPTVLRVLESVSKQRRASVIFLKEMSFRYDAVVSNSFFKPPVEPVLGLRIRNWRSSDDYLNAMKAKYRKHIVDARDKLIELGATIQAERDIDSCLDELFTLFTSFVRSTRDHRDATASRMHRFVTWATNYPRQRVTIMTRDVFKLLQKSFPDDLDITTIRINKRIVGMTMNLRDASVFYSMYTAMVRKDLAPSIYRTLLAAKVSNAINAGCSYMHFGRTGQMSKADCGAEVLEEGCYTRIFPGWMNRLLLPIMAKINAHQPPFMPRNVFKSEKLDQSADTPEKTPVNVT